MKAKEVVQKSGLLHSLTHLCGQHKLWNYWKYIIPLFNLKICFWYVTRLLLILVFFFRSPSQTYAFLALSLIRQSELIYRQTVQTHITLSFHQYEARADETPVAPVQNQYKLRSAFIRTIMNTLPLASSERVSGKALCDLLRILVLLWRAFVD